MSENSMRTYELNNINYYNINYWQLSLWILISSLFSFILTILIKNYFIKDFNNDNIFNKINFITIQSTAVFLKLSNDLILNDFYKRHSNLFFRSSFVSILINFLKWLFNK